MGNVERRQSLGWDAQPSKAETVKAGQDAWLRTKADTTWHDWLLVGAALSVGRAMAMAKAATNTPAGSRYNREFGNWLDHHGFSDLDKGDRARLFAVLANLPAIESWRATLTQTERARLNHPHSVLRRWQATTNVLSSRKPTKSRASVAAQRKELEATTARAEEAEAARDLPDQDEPEDNGFCVRAQKAKQAAQYSGPVDDIIVGHARAAAEAWTELADRLEQTMAMQIKTHH